ncbi:PEPxxWA-CTERM sorting domain-containing protein [Sphingomonas sp. KR1UV-12]|uniref:PEPxxWA-CTERM sorting domain-containing protein n=1 Tax=Sphingomonas aurea TaxID=3063994 RepID=A0ABT9EFP2_9SPHN|nr:PEPxxWA-CTERM sorting domain-containing protein [Sphingomonas sp. KR1UV-12]MDP1025591.1 PEPxxWA-CTERM sorting domain-containing protein [Sphingomonas sp. KR1UV-12]
MKKLAITAAVLAAAVAAPASAVTVVATQGSNSGASANFSQTFAGMTNTVFDFNSGETAKEVQKLQNAGFTVQSGGTGNNSVQTMSVRDQYAMPAPSDGSAFAVVQARSNVSIYRQSGGYEVISLYLGSVDSYNSISLLNNAGGVIASYTGQQLLNFATPAGTANGQTAYRVTFTRNVGDAAFAGLNIASSDNSAEFDNLVFAVPEPSTWALMLAGFGMVGMAMRSRRRRTTAVFA